MLDLCVTYIFGISLLQLVLSLGLSGETATEVIIEFCLFSFAIIAIRSTISHFLNNLFNKADKII